ncbi:hypothetical protein C5167_006502 [Papaver somniferum]|uniref:BTB domain-containing protein n=1 Tax=Papaver somniferum TaxID=3469 RepID=A0A4Y7JDL3_PAPSO|nr:hypothetical protein C5167_006502 [Papaver somniferum]
MLIQDSSVWIALPDSWVSRARDTPSPRVLTCPLTKSAAAAFRTSLWKLLESGKGTYVNFVVDEETFAAHKLVLAARSPVFHAQLFGPMKDQNTQCIKIEDMEAPVFKFANKSQLLRSRLHKTVDWMCSTSSHAFGQNPGATPLIYWDALPDMQELTRLTTKWASTLMAQHLLAAADRYGLERIRLLCESKLCDDVAINTVATTLALAEQHHCFPLKSVYLKFVAMPENLRAVMQTDGFEYLKESCPAVLTELLEYVARVGELLLLYAIMKPCLMGASFNHVNT